MTTRSRSGIPTTYGGTRFRSRLEARWAAFFDLVEWPWVYEPFDGDRYIPDFLIEGESPFLLEVGPCVGGDDYREKATKALAAFPTPELGYPEHVVLVVGAAPFLREPEWSRRPIVGYVTDDGWGSGPDFARYARCAICDRIGYHHASGSFELRPCSHYDGDNLLRAVPEQLLTSLWAEAGNEVQWRPNRGRRVA